MREINIINVSGGKDSTATLLLALERGVPNLQAVFADTGHEHPSTYDYISYLEDRLKVEVQRVKADFSKQIARKRETVESTWPEPQRTAALEVLHPTGNPFLDLCLWKGLFPSSGQRFCTEFLKVKPIHQVQEAACEAADRVVTWLGIRSDESLARSTALEWEREFGPADEPEAGFWRHRPIVTWDAARVFDYISSKGVKHNPLYTQGMGRVGCMPCIMVRKSELSEIAKRFPAEIDRVSRWEELVSKASKRGDSTFVQPKAVRSFDKGGISYHTHGIREAVKWAQTEKGGRQFPFDFGDGGGCSSLYGLCETEGGAQ